MGVLGEDYYDVRYIFDLEESNNILSRSYFKYNGSIRYLFRNGLLKCMED